MKSIYLTIPNDAKYFSAVRLFISGVMVKYDFNVDKIEDIKMAVNEGLTIANKLDCNNLIDIEFELDEDIKIKITEICEEKIDLLEDLKMSKKIIECMVDDSYIQDESLILVIE